MNPLVPWDQAMQRALYDAPTGFYLRQPGPPGHFRTSASASPLFAHAIAELLGVIDVELGHPDPLDFVDMGAGRGHLVAGVYDCAPASLRQRLRATAVELAPRPDGLDPAIAWVEAVPPDLTGLLVANEWLDNVPVSVVQADGTQLREVLVTVEGEESLGGQPSPRDLAWLTDWWPLDPKQEGSRAEVGVSRDQAWAHTVGCLQTGVAIAIDYATSRADRVAGKYPAGTLTGYRAGRQVPPIPDGTCDLTAHAALDSCAAAGVAACGGKTQLVTQRDALAALGVSGQRPLDPHATGAELLANLHNRSLAAELRDLAGLGGFTWLIHSAGCGWKSGLADVDDETICQGVNGTL